MKVVIKLAVLGAIAVSVVGCSTIKTDELNANESTGLKDKSLVFSKYNKLPDFPAQTAVNVQFGLLGLATANANGNLMIRNNNIEDPAIEISRKLAKGLQENRGMKLAEETTDFVASHELVDVVKAYSQYDYILDVKTLGWNSIYYVSDWDNYRIFYSAHARLVDVKSKLVVAEEVCTAAPEYQNTNEAPNYENLQSGGGLKKELERAIDFCVEHIRSMAKLHEQEKVVATQ